MCAVDRRGFLAAGGAFLTAAAEAELLHAAPAPAGGAFAVKQLAKDVFFAEGDFLGGGFSNTGWVVLEDYVLVVDPTYPSGAREMVRRIRATTEKPIRFAFDTHHHGDHLYGNRVFVEGGATAVAHVGVLEELHRLETGQFGGAPGRWEGEAQERLDLKTSPLKPPSLLFPKEIFFDDGRQRVELVHLGVGHTRGDAYAWLPKEGILFTGDATVNGPFNFVGDGQIRSWIRTLDSVKALAPRVVCPGHGPLGDVHLVEAQQAYFKALWAAVEKDLSRLPPEAARKRVEGLRPQIVRDPRIARYAGDEALTLFSDHVAKVYQEMTGRKLVAADDGGRRAHARAHGLA